MKRGLELLLALIFVVSPVAARAEAGREFIMSCTYGVLAGSLVGAASLAFTQKPGDNLNRVARGASLGLYTGIALGFYVVYIVPGLEAEEGDPVAVASRMPLQILPTFHGDNIDGAQFQYRLLAF